MRTNVYIDGFNLYYGTVKGTRDKWLNLEALFTRLRPHDDVRAIYYFTALVSGPHRQSQMTYLRALETLPRVKIVLGHFKDKTVKCSVKECCFDGDRRFKVPEEKRTDVQIAIAMVNHAWQDDCDRYVLVSGDSDLVPAVNTVKMIAPDKKVALYIPARDNIRGAAVELRGACDTHKILPNLLVRKSQFPPELPDGSGGLIQKPSGW